MTKEGILGFLINQHLNLSIMHRHTSEEFQNTLIFRKQDQSVFDGDEPTYVFVLMKFFLSVH